MDFIASTKLADFLAPKRSGEPVNVHVVAPVREPAPDFDAMQKVIQGHASRSLTEAANVAPRSEKFPRGAELPSQSPLFWVEQKDRYLRQLLIRDIEELSGRRLVVYFGNQI
jgi:hypothetical protein